MQLPFAVNTVARLRRVHPDKNPEQLINFLGKAYLGLVISSGAGAGIAWTVLNGVDIEDYERRRFLVVTAPLGNTGMTTTTQVLGSKTVPHRGKQIINAILIAAIERQIKFSDLDALQNTARKKAPLSGVSSYRPPWAPWLVPAGMPHLATSSSVPQKDTRCPTRKLESTRLTQLNFRPQLWQINR